MDHKAGSQGPIPHTLIHSLDIMVGPRVFEIEQLDELLPQLEEIFLQMEEIQSYLKQLTIRINALEMIWGPKVHEPDNQDHGELQTHLKEMKDKEESFESCTRKINEIGGQLKGVDPGLVDFYGIREGRLVFLCWRRGETAIEHWHHIDEGFDGREPL